MSTFSIKTPYVWYKIQKYFQLIYRSTLHCNKKKSKTVKKKPDLRILCRKKSIPARLPAAPPAHAAKSKVLSRIRNFPFLALLLSSPYNRKANRFTAAKKSITPLIPVSPLAM